MASVRGTDPRLVAGSNPDCVTTNQARDTTYVGTGPDQLPLANNGKEKWPMLLDRKDRPHQRTHLSQRKKEIRIAFTFAFAFAFALHLSF
jgi:hypothetical protein